MAGFVFVASVPLYGFAYVYCLLYDRDALRSERYSLQKMAIEHGMIGDSKTGPFSETELSNERVAEQSARQIEHRP